MNAAAANAMHLSISNEHGTPPAIIAAARHALGAIDLDPASSPLFNLEVGAARYFTSRGLENAWLGRIFVNPPGGKHAKGSVERRTLGPSVAAAWWRKLAREYVDGRVDAAIYIAFKLDHLQSTQQRPEDLPIPCDFPMCFPRARLAYMKPDGDAGVVASKGPPHASAIIFLPPRDRFVYGMTSVSRSALYRFVEAFAPIGACIPGRLA